MLKIKKEYLEKELVFHLPDGSAIKADGASQSDLKKAKSQKGNDKFFESKKGNTKKLTF